MNLVPERRGSQARLILLAPPQAEIPDSFTHVDASVAHHEKWLAGMQCLRGRVYLEDGAITRDQIRADGRHRLPMDDRAWHVIALDEEGDVCGCSRYLEHPRTVSFSDLRMRSSALAKSENWGAALKDAVESDIRLASQTGVSYVEVGGWALAPEMRYSTQALRIALSTYSLARMLGGCIGIGTVTRRHCSSSILRRIGGSPLSSNGIALPHYFDPQYGCEMEVLRFDSNAPNPKYEGWITELHDYLMATTVIQRKNVPATLPQAAPVLDRGLREGWSYSRDLVHAV